LDPPATAASLVVIALLIGISVAWAKKRPLIAFSILFFFLNHLVESTVLPLELVYEHRNYIPSMFLFVPVAVLAVHAAARPGRSWMPHLVYGAATVLIASFAVGTYARNAAWQTEETLWLDAVGKYPDSYRAYHNLGRFYTDAGRYREAIYAYHQALDQPDPTHGQRRHVTYYNLGLIYHQLGDAAAAEAHLKRSLAVRPDYPDALANLGLFVAFQGRYKEAEQYLRRAIRAKATLQAAGRLPIQAKDRGLER
jgi:tetratricopeptide (TPR) repeat protein